MNAKLYLLLALAAVLVVQNTEGGWRIRWRRVARRLAPCVFKAQKEIVLAKGKGICANWDLVDGDEGKKGESEEEALEAEDCDKLCAGCNISGDDCPSDSNCPIDKCRCIDEEILTELKK